MQSCEQYFTLLSVLSCMGKVPDIAAPCDAQTTHFALGPDGEPGSCPAGYSHWTLKASGELIGCQPLQAEADHVLELSHARTAALGDVPYAGCSPCPWLSEGVWLWLEVLCVAVFTGEYLLRALFSSDLCEFALEPMNVVDLLAILPFYLELLLEWLDVNTQVWGGAEGDKDGGEVDRR